MIEIDAVQPTAGEFRSVKRGWGAIHWICAIPTYAFLLGFLLFGLIAVSVGDPLIPPGLFGGFLIASWLLWWFGQVAVRRVLAAAQRRSPAGDLPWNWRIDADGLSFDTGLLFNKIDWRAVKLVDEEKDRFLFLVTPANNPVLPKRQMTAGQIEALRALIAEVRASGRMGRGVD